MPKTSDKISLKPKPEDLDWLKEQAESLGVDDPALALSALLRWARLNGVTLGVASNVGSPPRRQVTAPVVSAAAAPFEAAPSDDFSLELAPEVLPANEFDIAAMVEARVAEATAAGALDLVPAPDHLAPQAAVIPLRLNDRRGYLLGSTAVRA